MKNIHYRAVIKLWDDVIIVAGPTKEYMCNRVAQLVYDYIMKLTQDAEEACNIGELAGIAYECTCYGGKTWEGRHNVTIRVI